MQSGLGPLPGTSDDTVLAPEGLGCGIVQRQCDFPIARQKPSIREIHSSISAYEDCVRPPVCCRYLAERRQDSTHRETSPQRATRQLHPPLNRTPFYHSAKHDYCSSQLSPFETLLRSSPSPKDSPTVRNVFRTPPVHRGMKSGPRTAPSLRDLPRKKTKQTSTKGKGKHSAIAEAIFLRSTS